MGLKAKDNTTNRISIGELILGGVASWLIGKLLDFAWTRGKKTLSTVQFDSTLERVSRLTFQLIMLGYGMEEQKVESLLSQYDMANVKDSYMLTNEFLRFICQPLVKTNRK